MKDEPTKSKLRGVFAPVTTPFEESGKVDAAGLRFNMDRYANSGLKGYLALGSNGENKSLTGEEKRRVLDVIIQNKAPNQIVMAGCIAESTRETIHLARMAEELGADFATLLPPSYFKKQMTDEVCIVILQRSRMPLEFRVFFIARPSSQEESRFPRHWSRRWLLTRISWA